MSHKEPINRPLRYEAGLELAAPLRPARLWIFFCVYLNLAGWGLSGLGCLDAAGYGWITTGGVIALWIFRKHFFPFKLDGRARWQWRFRHFLPTVFVALWAMALAGGLLYAPNNYDGLTYRLPRVLHWLAEHRWYWIDIPNSRMNLSAPGFEWLMAPLLALAKCDRAIFLINWISFGLLPGLTYATLVRMGVAKRVSWYWMWLLPTGHCFATQAGSIGNDAFAVVYLLASIVFPLQARISRKVSDLLVGALAAALLTGAKASNIPLLLPWVIASIPSVGLLWKNFGPASLAGAAFVFSSFFPLAVANSYYAGKWTGDRDNKFQMQIENPVYGLFGNGLQLLAQNAVLPVMPCVGFWNRKADQFLSSPLGEELLRNFPRLYIKCGEITGEEGAGMGAGLGLLLGISVFALPFQGRRKPPVRATASCAKIGVAICAGGWAAILVYMAKMGSESAARLFTPYYFFVIATILLLPGISTLVRRRWWTACAGMAALSAFAPVILHPSRPLWPALTVFKKLSEAHPGSGFAAKGLAVYSVFRDRADGLAPLRDHLSAQDAVVGFVGADDSEVSLWRPFGSRKVVEVTPSNLSKLAQSKLLVFARGEGIQVCFRQPVEEWIRTAGGRVVATEKLCRKASRGAEEWYVVRLGAGNTDIPSAGETR